MSNDHPALPESQAGQAYYWAVRPCRAIDSCAPDPVSADGMATNAFRKESPKVVTAAVPTPVVGGQSVVTSSEVSFDWNDYFDTNRATTWRGELSNQSAMQYRVQVSTSDTFSTRLDDVLVDQSTYTAYDRLYPDGTLYWRVQAIDGDSNGLAWSTVRSFVKSSPSASSATRSAAPTFGHDAVPLAGTAVQRVVPHRGLQERRCDVLRDEQAVLQGRQDHGVRVERDGARLADGLRVAGPPHGRVRQRRRLVGHRSVLLRRRGAGSARSHRQDVPGPNGPLFSWTDVPGASSYVLEYQRGTSSTSVTTAATAWATDRNLGDGTYTWRVTAKDPSRNTLGVSGWRTFSVDGTAPKITSYSPRSSARRTTNFTATFSESVKGVSGTTVRLYLGTTKVRAKVTYSSTKRRATLDPNAYLKRGKTYTMKVSGGIKDARGNAVAAKNWKVKIT